MSKIYSNVVSEIDLGIAVKKGSIRNDLLPPRNEDQVGGEIQLGFTESIHRSMDKGTYVPVCASFVQVPKQGFSTRRAALLTLRDRVVYYALVSALCEKIEKSMIGGDIVMWPRAKRIDKRWRDFEVWPSEKGKKYVVRADIADFYESIDHEILCELLVDITGKKEIVTAIGDFLGQIMRSNRGLPQGLDSSDVLATAYLVSLDSYMTMNYIDYIRHGDDIRIAVSSFYDARKALFDFEKELRGLNLSINQAKSMVLLLPKYKSVLEEGDRIIEETKAAIREENEQELEDEDVLQEILVSSGKTDLAELFFYHNELSFEEIISELAEEIEPSEIEVYGELFKDSMSRMPNTEIENGMDKEVFHFRIVISMTRLAAGKSDFALSYVKDLVESFPEKTELCANYLYSLNEEKPKEIIEVIESILLQKRFFTSWELSWWMFILEKIEHDFPEKLIKYIYNVATNEQESSIARASALKVLGSRGELKHELVMRLWNILPENFKGDVVASVFMDRKPNDWIVQFKDSIKTDPITKVVARHVQERLKHVKVSSGSVNKS